jgi:hypothetical protein
VLRVSNHPGQYATLQSERRFVFMIAGTQGGKTGWAPFWLKREIERKGPGDYLAVTATFPLLNLKMKPEFLKIFRDTLHLGEWRESEKIFLMADGTRIIFCSAENSESVESATAKAVWCDEAGQYRFKLDTWEAVQRRLSIHQGRALITTTPYNLGWLKTEHDRWQAGDPNYDVINFPSIMNPVFPKEEYQRAKDTLPDWKFKLFYEAKFTRPAGLIYEDYLDEYEGHKIKSFAIPQEWPRYVGIDPGAVHTALVWLAHDTAKNVYYAYRESCEGGLTTGQHVAHALSLAANENVANWFLGAKSEKQYRLDWQAAGISAREPAIVDVEAGIDRVIGLFKARRLYIFDTLRGLRDDLGSYSRELDDNGQTTDKIRDKESYHYADALRYVVLGLSGPRAEILWV